MSERLIELPWGPEMPGDRSVRIGCIGSGFIMADCHLPAYRGAGLNPAAIAGRSAASVQAVAARHGIGTVHDSPAALLADESLPVIDIAVPPDVQAGIIRLAAQKRHIRGILAQKPLGVNLAEARELVKICEDAGIVLAVNQNMRWDQSVRACRGLLDRGMLGEPVLASIDMRAIPHWMPWQERLGWVTLRIMSIHHLDTFRYWVGDPARVFASVRPDPRTSFPHEDGIALYVLEYESGARAFSCDDVWAGPSKEGAAADIGIRWRLEGTRGMARGTIGWPGWPERVPSTIDYTTVGSGEWHSPRWEEAWFPDAFAGPMADLLCALEKKRPPAVSGRDNLGTMALVEACYVSAREHRAVSPAELQAGG